MKGARLAGSERRCCEGSGGQLEGLALLLDGLLRAVCELLNEGVAGLGGVPGCEPQPTGVGQGDGADLKGGDKNRVGCRPFALVEPGTLLGLIGSLGRGVGDVPAEGVIGGLSVGAEADAGACLAGGAGRLGLRCDLSQCLAHLGRRHRRQLDGIDAGDLESAGARGGGLFTGDRLLHVAAVQLGEVGAVLGGGGGGLGVAGHGCPLRVCGRG